MAELKIDFEKMIDGFTETIKKQGMFVGCWIPVSERLPERDVLVLCSIRDGCSTYRVIITKNNGMSFWEDGTIEAWMPLPEPYNNEEK